MVLFQNIVLFFLQVNKEGTVAIRRKTSRPVTACPPPTDEEDIYGRLTNMKLSSFAEEQQMLQQQQLQQQECLFHLFSIKDSLQKAILSFARGTEIDT